MYGRIIWTHDPDLRDTENPNPTLRQRKLRGIVHIRGFRYTDDGIYRGGTIYNPEDGETYGGTLELLDERRLRIQGRPKVPVLGGILGALFGRIHYNRIVKKP